MRADFTSTAALIIPALNEAAVLGRTLSSIPSHLFRAVIVADNGSTDGTPEIARAHGARVTIEAERGYGATCLRALASLEPDVEAVVFMQADLSEDPREAALLLAPLIDGRADLVVGSRTLGQAERWAVLPHQAFGNWLTLKLIRLLYGRNFTDLGPYRAIRTGALRQLQMRDRNYGWVVEMQVRAIQEGLRILEVPVSYRIRAAGENKVSGKLLPSLRAGIKMLWTAVALRMRSVHSAATPGTQ